MDKSIKPLFAGLLLLSSFPGLAQSRIAIAPVESGVVNVLVKVDKKGSVKNFLIAERFSPSIEAMLERTIKGLSITPSPSSSSKQMNQIVLRLKLQAAERLDGSYDAKFVAFDYRRVPSGSWSWTVYDDRQLALVENNSPRQRIYNRIREYNPAQHSWPIESPFQHSPATQQGNSSPARKI
jgi:hypothetical protein